MKCSTHKIFAMGYGAFCALMLFFVFGSASAYAASLRLTPDTGVYTAGTTFTARVVVNTSGQSINAAEGDLSFNPADLSVVSVSKAGSIFNLWTREPEFSNSAGTISFGGGSPSGYTGSAGTVVVITFKTKHAGTTKVNFSQGSVLAADGKGTNVIAGMQGGSYTVQVASETPQPEYVAPPNTPAAPVITSPSHPDERAWYTQKSAVLSWKLPSGVTAVRTLLDTSPSTVPTKVYDTPISTLTVNDLPEGVSYMHVQLKNADGWGRVAHYRLAVDSEKPTAFTIEAAPENDKAAPEQKLLFKTEDAGSGVVRYEISIDGGEKFTFEDKDKKGLYTTPLLSPGAHRIIVEGFDAAGNSIIATYDFTIDAFDKPLFTEYPTELPQSVIPVLRGTTRPEADVTITVSRLGVEPRTYTTKADSEGVFTFIPEGRFEVGVYEISARARDAHGSQSEDSDTIRMAVQEPGLIRVLGMAVSFLSVFVPLLALLVVLSFGAWLLFHRMRLLRRRVRREAHEAQESLAHEIEQVLHDMHTHIDELSALKKGRVSKQEIELFASLEEHVTKARARVRKEIDDIERIVGS